MGKLLLIDGRARVGRPDERGDAVHRFKKANDAAQAGHEAQIDLANEAVDLVSGVIADNLMPFGWPSFKEILAETVASGVRIPV